MSQNLAFTIKVGITLPFAWDTRVLSFTKTEMNYQSVACDKEILFDMPTPII